MASHIESRRPGLASLPEELLHHIVDSLALEPLELCDIRLPLTEQRKLGALLNLSLTSKTFHRITVPVLYEVVVLDVPRKKRPGRAQQQVKGTETERDPLSLFLRTLMQRPSYRPLVKHVSCLVPLYSKTNDVPDAGRSWPAIEPSLDLTLGMDAWVFEITESQMGSRDPDSDSDDDESLLREVDVRQVITLGETLFARVLCLTPSLESVHLEWPLIPQILSPLRPRVYEWTRYWGLDFLLETIFNDDRLGPTFLRKLKTIKTQPMLAPNQFDHVPLRGTQQMTNIYPAPCRAPNIERIDTYRAAGDWTPLPETVREVRAHSVACLTWTLYEICRAPKLERLTFNLNAGPGYEPAEEEEDNFNSALLQRAKTLKYLKFTTEGYHFCPPRYVQDFGPVGRLHCLAKFEVLEELVIETMSLVGKLQGFVGFHESLPRSLRRLVLFELWHSDSQPDPIGFYKYQMRLDERLEELARNCQIPLLEAGIVTPAKLPHLRNVVFYLNRSKYGSWRTLHLPMKRAREMFASAGVLFQLSQYSYGL